MIIRLYIRNVLIQALIGNLHVCEINTLAFISQISLGNRIFMQRKASCGELASFKLHKSVVLKAGYESLHSAGSFKLQDLLAESGRFVGYWFISPPEISLL